MLSGMFGKSKKLEDCMLQNLIKQGDLPWEWLDEDEQQRRIEASKQAHGFYKKD